jgi:uncharacterized protein YutD
VNLLSLFTEERISDDKKEYCSLGCPFFIAIWDKKRKKNKKKGKGNFLKLKDL